MADDNPEREPRAIGGRTILMKPWTTWMTRLTMPAYWLTALRYRLSLVRLRGGSSAISKRARTWRGKREKGPTTFVQLPSVTWTILLLPEFGSILRLAMKDLRPCFLFNSMLRDNLQTVNREDSEQA